MIVPCVSVQPHPLLELGLLVTTLPQSLGQLASPTTLIQQLCLEAETPLAPEETIKGCVRDLLRVGGFKPSGRNKPASEYLVQAASKGRLGPINLVVDACNVASLHSGLPISVVDCELGHGDWRIEIAAADSSYIFNRSGQVIDVSGLWCLHDALGPCANAVKDSQRTKTSEDTVRTLSVVWGTSALPGRTRETLSWYRSILDEMGARTEELPLRLEGSPVS